jgi:mRNA-degrading endonuclease RelE of RelBE toxin-antitoxin system
VEFSVLLSNSAERGLKRLPRAEVLRIRAAIDAMRADPFSGDLQKLKGTAHFRRRVGDYRIIFAVDIARRVVAIVDVARRTSTTYR